MIAPASRRPRPRRVPLRLLIAVCVVLIVECAWFNLPYFTSAAASTDTPATVGLGPGLRRTAQGMLEVTDPTGAYMITDADGTSPYWRATPSSAAHIDAVRDSSDADLLRSTVHLRFASDGVAGPEQWVSPWAPRSLYMRYAAHGPTKVWVVEAAGSIVPIEGVRPNVRVPFDFDWARVALMAALACAVLAFAPGSRLWRTPLRTDSRRQRLLFAAALAPLACYTLWKAFWSVRYASPLSFHTPGGYTYDFDQYGHVADALLHGHAWLDLPVPDGLAASANPYDVTERERLLAGGVEPIYWDYAFRDGRWYSYFGLLPSVLLFLPFRVVTSWFVPGGLMLPAACAETLLMFGVAVVSCLLVIRLVRRAAPGSPVAAVALLCVAYLLGANTVYLWFRTNFYSIPFAAALLLATLGLWLWLGARRDGGDPRPSRVAAGALCVAATLGCRPTFALSALFALPLFGPWALRRIRCGRAREAAGMLAALCAPAAIVAAPVLWYNHLRFGSFLDFGNAYQLTVTDMTRFRTPASNIAPTLLYYLALPARWTGSFPFLELSPTPLPRWSFTEPCVAGLFAMMPLAALALAVPFLRRRLAGLWSTLMTALGLGVVLLAVDSWLGGFGWRYIADFGWLFMLAATPVAARAMRAWRPARAAVAVLVAYGVVLAAASCFVVGRDDMLVANDPALFHTVRAWFALLP